MNFKYMHSLQGSGPNHHCAPHGDSQKFLARGAPGPTRGDTSWASGESYHITGTRLWVGNPGSRRRQEMQSGRKRNNMTSIFSFENNYIKFES